MLLSPLTEQTEGIAPVAPDAEQIGLALEAAGMSAYLAHGGEAVTTLFPEVMVAWAGDGFRVFSHEEVQLPAVSETAAMEIQLEARALARKWSVVWSGGVGGAEVRVSFSSSSNLHPREPPTVGGARLQEAAARVHVAHLLLKQRASQIAWVHADRGGWAHERSSR